jgi:hypothetical protein
MNHAPGVLWLVAVAALLPAAVHGQAQGEGDLFLDFLASDRAGQPVADLTANEVRLRIGGKARPLLSLEYVGATDIPREIVLLVDEPTLYGLEPVAREAISALLASLPAGDRISYLTTRRTGGLNPNPGPEAVLAGLEAMQTGPGELWTCIPDLQRAIERIARLLPPGRGSVLAVLTRGVLHETDQVADRSIGCAPGRLELRQTQGVIASTQISLHIFAVSQQNRSWGLDTIAANTAGSSGALTFRDSGALFRMLTATRPFYRATFAADPTTRTPQRVDITTTRSGVRITASPAIELHTRKP